MFGFISVFVDVPVKILFVTVEPVQTPDHQHYTAFRYLHTHYILHMMFPQTQVFVVYTDNNANNSKNLHNANYFKVCIFRPPKTRVV